jgi:hypothetical protein
MSLGTPGSRNILSPEDNTPIWKGRLGRAQTKEDNELDSVEAAAGREAGWEGQRERPGPGCRYRRREAGWEGQRERPGPGCRYRTPRLNSKSLADNTCHHNSSLLRDSICQRRRFGRLDNSRGVN